jgi:hypothetical protein
VLDTLDGWMYWAGIFSDELRRAHLDGSANTLIYTEVDQIIDVAFEPR